MTPNERIERIEALQCAIDVIEERIQDEQATIGESYDWNLEGVLLILTQILHEQ